MKYQVLNQVYYTINELLVYYSLLVCNIFYVYIVCILLMKTKFHRLLCLVELNWSKSKFH